MTKRAPMLRPWWLWALFVLLVLMIVVIGWLWRQGAA